MSKWQLTQMCESAFGKAACKEFWLCQRVLLNPAPDTGGGPTSSCPDLSAFRQAIRFAVRACSHQPGLGVSGRWLEGPAAQLEWALTCLEGICFAFPVKGQRVDVFGRDFSLCGLHCWESLLQQLSVEFWSSWSQSSVKEWCAKLVLQREEAGVCVCTGEWAAITSPTDTY